MNAPDLVDHIEALFEAPRVGRAGWPDDAVSPLAHALQCAQLAEWANADDSLVAAALLHDVGHLVERVRYQEAGDDAHDLLAVAFLAAGFGPEVVQPVYLHVQAKRYLVSVDPRYGEQLAPAAQRSLARQGGPMRAEEIRAFEDLPHAAQAVALRRWDDLAWQPGKRTPPLAYYLPLLRSQLRDARTSRPAPTVVGSLDV